MALFTSKKDRELQARMIEALEKANNLASTPYAVAGGYASDPNNSGIDSSGGQGLLQNLGRIVAEARMPQLPYQYGSAMGPGYPFQVAPLDPGYDDTGRALPRLWQYLPATNLNLNFQMMQWESLWAVAQQVDLVTRGIVIKIDELTRLDWSFVIDNRTVAAIMAEQNCTHAKANKIAHQKFNDQIVFLNEAWENPYPQLGRTFTEWATEFLWNHLVCDGVPVYPRYSLGRDVLGFELIDPGTIKCLLDNRGAIPIPPGPAYQQLIWGFPRGDYQASPEGTGAYPMFAGGGSNNEFLRDQLAYFVRERRTRSPYGLSVVEQCVNAATLYMERRRWLRAEYTSGTRNDTYFETDSDKLTGIEPLKLAGYERLLNDQLEGQTQARRGGKVLPPGLHAVFSPQIDEKYKVDYDNHLILMMAAIIGIAPSAYGVIPRSGLGGRGEREGEQQAVLSMSQKPVENFFAESINTLCRRFYGSPKEITFQWNDADDDSGNSLERIQGFQIALTSGQMTLNDVRGEQGLPEYENMPEADVPFIVAGNEIIFIPGLLNLDAGGNPTGQKGQPSEAQGPKEEQEEGPSGGGSGGGQAPQAGLDTEDKMVRAELIRFMGYVGRMNRENRWRPFEFDHVPSETAEKLNDRGYFIAKGAAKDERNWAFDLVKAGLAPHPKLQSIEAHYEPLIREAIKKSVRNVRQAIEAATETLKGLTPDDSQRAAAHNAAQHVTFDTSGLSEVLSSLYRDGGLVGAAASVRELGEAAVISSKLGETALAFDWGSWEPGSPVAASMTADGQLGQVLSNLNITIKGMNDTLTDDIGNAIAEGLASGESAASLAKSLQARIDDLADDPARAKLIAVTETNRAYNAAAIDTYSASGCTGFTWVDYEGACEFCEGQAGPHDLTDPTPPGHPNCRCYITGIQA